MFASTERDVLINMTTDDDIIINLTTDSNIVISSTTSDITSRSLDDVERWMLGLMGVVVWINGVVGNILILVTLYCQPLLRSTHNIFLGNLALADLFIVGQVCVWVCTCGVKGWEDGDVCVRCTLSTYMIHPYVKYPTESAIELAHMPAEMCVYNYDTRAAISVPIMHALS